MNIPLISALTFCIKFFMFEFERWRWCASPMVGFPVPPGMVSSKESASSMVPKRSNCSTYRAMSAFRIPLASQMRMNSLLVAFGSMARRDSAMESSGLRTHLSTASMRENSRSTVRRKDRAKLLAFVPAFEEEEPPHRRCQR